MRGQSPIGDIAAAIGKLHVSIDVMANDPTQITEVWGAALLTTKLGFLEDVGLFTSASAVLRINSSDTLKPAEVLQDSMGNEHSVALPAGSYALRFDGNADFRIDSNNNGTFAVDESVALLTGTFVLEFSPDGFNVALFAVQGGNIVPASIDIWPSSGRFLHFGVQGFFAIRTGGIAADMVLTASADLPLGLATGVWIGGGDQNKLTELFNGTDVVRGIHGVFQRGGVIGGTSSGCAIMSDAMICRGYEEIEFGQGFALYPRAIVQNVPFEQAKIPPNSQDLVIGNVPFDKDGPRDDRYPKLSLHNYFLARSIDALKPGGLLVEISSASTLDNQTASQRFRDWAGERADLVWAVRLPNTAFKSNAGTEVTTDIIVLRKKDGAAFPYAQPWRAALPRPRPARDGGCASPGGS